MSVKSLDKAQSVQHEHASDSAKRVGRKPKPSPPKTVIMLATLGYGLTLAVIVLFMLNDIAFHI